MVSAWLETMGWAFICASALVGIGALVLSALTAHPERSRGTLAPARAFWLGLLVSMPLLFAWHLVLPIDGRAAAVLAAVGLAGLLRERWGLVRGVRRAAKEQPLSLIAWTLAWCGLPWVTLQPLSCVDAGFYYVASVEWHRAFAQVPGLQATNPLSVMNAGNFLLTAAAGTGPFVREGHLVLNGMLAWWAVPLVVGGVERVARTGSARGLVVVLAAAPGVDALFDDRMACPSADIGVAWLGVAMSAIALAEPRSTRTTLWAAVLVAVLAPFFKMSLAPFSLALLGLALWRHRRVLEWRPLGFALALGALAWVPYLAGNVITSGYPLYPSAALGFSFDWALPEPLVRQVSHIIRGYSQHDGIMGTPTLPEQLARLLLMNRAVLFPAVLLVGGSVLAIVRRVRGAQVELGALIAAWGFVVMWFVLAPDPRFAGAALWALGGLCLTLGLSRTLDLASRVALTGVAVLLLLGDVPYMTVPPLPRVRPTVPDNSNDALSPLVDGTLILDCTPLSTVMPKGDILAGQKPDKGYAPCWSVPCAALFPSGLQRRDAQDVSKGFKLPPDAKLPPLSIE